MVFASGYEFPLRVRSLCILLAFTSNFPVAGGTSVELVKL
jgi:hypothetical protein